MPKILTALNRLFALKFKDDQVQGSRARLQGQDVTGSVFAKSLVHCALRSL